MLGHTNDNLTNTSLVFTSQRFGSFFGALVRNDVADRGSGKGAETLRDKIAMAGVCQVVVGLVVVVFSVLLILGLNLAKLKPRTVQ